MSSQLVALTPKKRDSAMYSKRLLIDVRKEALYWLPPWSDKQP